MNYVSRIRQRLVGSLRARVLGPTIVLFALTLLAMGLGAIKLHAVDMERGQRERAELFTDMVANGVTTLMLQGEPGEVSQMLVVVAGHRNDVDSISLVRPNGTIAFSSQPVMVESRPWLDTSRFSRLIVVDAPGGNRSQYAVVEPIRNRAACGRCHGFQSKVNGWLDVRFSREPVQLAQRRLARVLALTGVPALLALLGVAAWLLRREVVQPVHQLIAVMRKAAEGALDVRADVGRPDEIGIAARGFDSALAALRSAQLELESFYRERMIHADRFATVGELATSLAHEIKNPLAGLSGALEVLAEDLARSPEQADVVDEMRHQVTRLAKIMDALLSFARPPRPQPRPTDLNAIVRKVLFLIERQRRRTPIELRLELTEGLPLVQADPAQLEQVFLNLCLNGVQAMESSGGTLTVRTSRQDEHVIVEIADTGAGIPAEVRPHLFKPFFTTKGNGSGLGLAISARIVAEHNGHIDYVNPSEGGTVFRIRLRLNDVRERAA